MVFNATFNNISVIHCIVAVSFIGEGNRSTQRKLPTCRKSLTTGRWFSPGTPVSSTNKADSDDVAEIFLKVALNTITLALKRGGNNHYMIVLTFRHIIQLNVIKRMVLGSH
jgi:hypothetical protein